MCRCGGAFEHEHLSTNSLSTKSLFEYINVSQCCALNTTSGDIVPVFMVDKKSHIQNFVLESDTDEQMILQIRFTSAVKIRSLRIAAPPHDEYSPTDVSIFCNSMVNFTSLSTNKPTQRLSLLREQEHNGQIIDYLLQGHLFTNVNSLSLFFTNTRLARTQLVFVGFSGDFLNMAHAPVRTMYELKPSLADHKREADWQRTSPGNLGF